MPSFLLRLYNFLFFPLRAVLPNETYFLRKLGLTSLKEERIQQALFLANGRLLDVGCGNNELIKRYRTLGFSGTGIDIYLRKGVDVICDSERFVFKDEQFDTISFIASLNHCPNRKRAIQEARRVLKPNGRIIITMINPFIGFLCHKLAIKDFDQIERGMRKEEKYGLTTIYILKIFNTLGFALENHKTFVYGLNHLFVFKKKHNSQGGKF